MHIQDKVIVITGGASGLGLATADYLLQEKGARVAIFDLNVEASEKVVAELGADRAFFVQTDVSSEESVQQAVDAVMEKFGAIHVCINGAALPAAFKVLGRDAGQPLWLHIAVLVLVTVVFAVLARSRLARSE